MNISENKTERINEIVSSIDFSKFPKVRNRDETRALKKVLQKSGKTKQEIKDIIGLAKMLASSFDTEGQSKTRMYLREGEKVKFNIDKITSHSDWVRKQNSYKEFVESNVEKIFTVALIEQFKEKPYIVTFAEDTSEQQWWFAADDLLVYDKSDDTYKELWMIEEKEAKDELS